MHDVDDAQWARSVKRCHHQTELSLEFALPGLSLQYIDAASWLVADTFSQKHHRAA